MPDHQWRLRPCHPCPPRYFSPWSPNWNPWKGAGASPPPSALLAGYPLPPAHQCVHHLTRFPSNHHRRLVDRYRQAPLKESRCRLKGVNMSSWKIELLKLLQDWRSGLVLKCGTRSALDRSSCTGWREEHKSERDFTYFNQLLYLLPSVVETYAPHHPLCRTIFVLY